MENLDVQALKDTFSIMPVLHLGLIISYGKKWDEWRNC